MDPITQYLELARRRPELFVPSEHFPLFLDEVTLRRYAAATGRPVGVVYDNSPYYLVLADLCLDAGGPYTYARVIYPHHSSGAVVIPRRGDRFGLLSIFRHPTRSESGGEFPRGFSEGHSPAETAARELEEELGARVDPDGLEYLGDVQPDTGLSSGRVQVFLARVDQAAVPPRNREGIHGLRWVTEADLQAQIAAGLLTDGITLAAYARYCCRVGGGRSHG